MVDMITFVKRKRLWLYILCNFGFSAILCKKFIYSGKLRALLYLWAVMSVFMQQIKAPEGMYLGFWYHYLRVFNTFEQHFLWFVFLILLYSWICVCLTALCYKMICLINAICVLLFFYVSGIVWDICKQIVWPISTLNLISLRSL